LVVAVIAEKGGVGKTTLSLTLAVAVLLAGRKVAV
jgi:cellulose biosynthesis protein BcsQ